MYQGEKSSLLSEGFVEGRFEKSVDVLKNKLPDLEGFFLIFPVLTLPPSTPKGAARRRLQQRGPGLHEEAG